MITTDANDFVRQLNSSDCRPVYSAYSAEIDAADKTSFPASVKLSDQLPSVSPSRWPELMSISTLAQYLDMSTSSVRNLVSEGVLPDATTAPSPRLKRWNKSVIDNTLQRIIDRKSSHGLSMADALKTAQPRSVGGR